MQHLQFLKQRIIRIVFALQLVLLSSLGFAQDKKVEISIGEKDTWYQQPWVWVVGAAVFILLLVAILRSGKKD